MLAPTPTHLSFVCLFGLGWLGLDCFLDRLIDCFLFVCVLIVVRKEDNLIFFYLFFFFYVQCVIIRSYICVMYVL